jgi:serine/threonine protein kinase/Tol biopolymer transport system component
MFSMIGKTIGHYEVKEKLGEGGMGVVYRALDTHLDRSVAIKVLPPEAVSDPDRKQRFVQEAKSASALNHPNIIHIYDINRADGIDFIAMEYVPGKTLAQLIKHKAVKIDEALKYAVQIADALAAAHGAGIVHHDLKPANIMVTESGLVKVLDFGLAKLMESAQGGEIAATLTMQPVTEKGMIVGTTPYMSPEQAQGKSVDARTDIFSFGSVLYGMLTGQRAFEGESNAMTLASILEKEPKPLGEIVRNAPAEIERVLTRCLRKDPQRRWQSMADLKIALQDLKEESDSGKLRASTVESRAKGARIWIPVLSLLLIAIAAAFVLWRYLKPAPATQELRSERFTSDPGITMSPTLTPEGKLAAYASDRSGEGNLDIYVQATGGGQATQRTRHAADDYQPSFAPDGSQIVFRSERDGGGIYIVDTFGGRPERKLAANGWAPAFSPDGSTIAYASLTASQAPGTPQKLFLISPQGGSPRPFQPQFSVRSTQTVAEIGFRPFCWSPEGKHILFAGYESGSQSLEWWVAPLDGGPPVNTGAVAGLKPHGFLFDPLAWYGRHIYFSAGSMVEGLNIFRVPIGLDSKIIPPEQELNSGAGTTPGLAISTDNHVLFSIMNPAEDFVSLPVDLNRGTALGQAAQVTSDATIKGHASLTGDGKILAYLAFISWTNHRSEIRKRNLDSGTETPLISENIPNVSNLCISPDGSQIGYVGRDSGKLAGFVGSSDSLPGRRICEGCQIVGFFSNSQYVLIVYDRNRLVRQDLNTGDQRPILTTGSSPVRQPNNGMDVRLSPDEKWVAFTTALPDGEVAMYVAPVGNASTEERDWIRIRTTGACAQSPVWSPDNGLLYYLDDRDGHMCIWAQRLDRKTKRPQGESFSVYHFHRPEMSFAGFKNSIYLLGARDKLIVNVWTMKSNLFRAKLDSQ